MRIYADYASITPTDPKVLEEYLHASRTYIGNPSSLHRIGTEAAAALKQTRLEAAQTMGARAEDIIFTGSGTEANNLAIIGYIENLYNGGRSYIGMHVIVSAIEHSSVMESVKLLESRGVRVSYAPVLPDGMVDLATLRNLISRDTVLVSVMMVNNEIGTIEPISEIAKLIRAERKVRDSSLPIALHTDAAQAFLYQDIDVRKLGADMMTLDSHKVYGPRGVGLLWLAKGVDLAPVIVGGGQERGLRSGTEALPTIIAFVYALRLALQLRASETKRLAALRDYFIKELRSRIPGTIVHGGKDCAPHIVNFTLVNSLTRVLEGESHASIDHEYLAFALDAQGIMVSTKSACLRDKDESYVLSAVGEHRGSLRVSFGRSTTKGEAKTILSTLVKLYLSKGVQESQVSVKI